MTTLAEHMIVAGTENRPPMFDKTMYNSWQSRMLLYIKGKKNSTMMLESIENGPLIYPTIEENGQIPKDIWDRVKLLMQGTELSYQERECKLYSEFDTFTSIKGESLHEYYLRFAQLINDMHTIGMTMQQVQVNTKFLNALQLEWSKFVTDVKLAKNIYLNPLALVANYQTQTNSSQYPQQISSIPQTTHSSLPYSPTYEAPHYPQPYQQGFQTQLNHTPLSVPQNAYHTPLISQQLQAMFPQLDSRLVVPSFLPTDDPIACLNKAMEFMSTVMASRFPSTNNQLRTSSILRNQATIQDGSVTVQQVQGRHSQSFAGIGTTGMLRALREILLQAQEAGQVLDEEKFAFLGDPRVTDVQVTQTTIPLNVAFQTDDLDAYDSDFDDISSAKAVLMANLSSYDSDILSEVPHHDTYQNDDMINQSVQETQCFEQSLIDYVLDNEITSDSNIISYEHICNKRKMQLFKILTLLHNKIL
ncbi:hypothetical protein Tco_1017988 [Tanacetum coccineum]|uniref:Integrase, catalytic region, zinc finger, CCHC-type, peptidase aspartic, catalytic n=1 Tax=Tanacetum coccineum TaxID=301880 RepID=A0ABQ5FT20_9ASTR